MVLEGANMDFTKLRAAALKDGDDEEAVTVNTRALIDKVLARYSGEWTTLRELLQNAADAQATSVTIKFETLPSASVPLSNTTNQPEILKHVLLHHTLRRLLVSNNGLPFGVNDWSRLKRIAEGNPDETKIGAFGVGFYSVFADCEEPFVSSGDQAMAFYWKGNSLFTRKLQLPAEEANPGTSFVLDYRNTTTPMPNLLSISQFLATSLTFVALQNIELWVDDWKIISLQKKSAPSVSVPIARDVETRTKEGLMQVRSMDRESVQMDATFMNVVGWKPSISAPKHGTYDSGYGSNSSDVPSLRSFFSRLTSTTSHTQQKTKAMREAQAMQEIVLEDLTAMTTAHVFLRVTTAIVKTSVSVSFASELERATKKPPPKTTKLAILTCSYDETTASTKENTVAKSVDIFSSVLPGKRPGGRIFIGFPTHQTTGAGMHLSAPSVIPTVERESIDLNARWVRTWNVEMLRVAGIMARLAFANEMADLSAKIKRAAESTGNKISKDLIAQFLPESLYTIRTFTFGDSTPSSQVSQIIEEAFWTTYRKPFIEIYSTQGVMPTTNVRLALEDLSGFVEGIPVVPDGIANEPFVSKLKDFGLLTEITISDIKKELEAKAMNTNQLIQFIGWAGRKAINGDIDAPTIYALMDVAVATMSDEGQGGIIALGSVKNYLNVSKIPTEMPLPPTTIPFQFTCQSSANELQALGWEPLEIVPWLRFLIETNDRRNSDQSLTSSVKFAGHVLAILSKSWDSLQQSKGIVANLLQHLTIVPTTAGMKQPGEAFFPSVKLFDDLPIVTPCQSVKEKLLVAIGVRKTVDLETIFNRLLSPSPDAKDGEISSHKRHMEVIKYLASVKDDIPAEELKRLKNSQICPAEAGPKGHENSLGTARLYRVSELFEPKDSLRSLRLPILQWPGQSGNYRPGSAETRFLSSLGLRPFPSVPELIDMMASSDVELRNRAMTYFIANHHINGYASFDVFSTTKPFLPLLGDGKRLVSPAECFTNEKCAVLGFNILIKELHIHANKFGILTDPPISECVNRLIARPPQCTRDASVLFGYFSSRLGEIGQNNVAKLGDARIVPIISEKKTENGYINEKAPGSGELRMLTPRQCYLGDSAAYGEIFDFVDFGNEANTFLMKCGSKNEPTKLELAAFACNEPARLLGIMQSSEKYLAMLRSLADDTATLKRDKALWKRMKVSKFLLGSIDIPSNRRKSEKLPINEDINLSDDDAEDGPIKQYQLALPNQIVVVDDYTSYRLFKGSLMSAPMEDKLEEFYLALGSSTLGSLVQEDLRLGYASEKQESAAKLRNHVLERSKLFLHESSRDNVKHDSRWLDKNLSVQVVGSISLRRSLRGHTLSHTEKRSAAIASERHKGWTLYVTPGKYDSYQISQAICPVLLERPTQQSYLTFETFLNLNLLQLRSRGYNVERILRQKAAEQRIAEEERTKQLEAEQAQIREQEQEWRQQALIQGRDAPREESAEPLPPPMPGSFGPDSPQDDKKRPNRGLFSGLTRRLGINSGGEVQQHLQNFLGGDHPSQPPMYEETTRQLNGKPTKSGSGTEQVSSPAAVQQNLVNAIQSSRAYNSSTLFSPPTTKEIKEQASYCDSTPESNIIFLADTANGMRIFVSKTLSSSPTDFLAQNSSELNAFAGLIFDVADIYNLPRKALHIFADEAGGTIAFNSNGSIFCNFRFYSQLHQQKMSAGEGKVEAASYWWVVVAHELAHNLVKPHSAEHSFYTEMLVSNYFPKMMNKSASYLVTPPARQQIVEASLLD